VIQAKVYDEYGSGVIAVATASGTIATPTTDAVWEVSLNYSDLMNLGDTFSQIKLTANLEGRIAEAQAPYPGTLTLTPIVDIFSRLAAALQVRFAGQIYYPQTAKMATPGQVYDGYTYAMTIDDNHQVWTKELGAYPEAATSAATQTYPFLVRFLTINPKLGDMRLQ
jgi:hypothetical protein